MSSNKSFFAPSGDFFSVAAFSDVLSTSASLAFRAAKIFFASFWRVGLVLLVAAAYFGIKLYDPSMSVDDFMYYIFSTKYSPTFPWHLFVPIAAFALILVIECAFFVSRVVRIMHSLFLPDASGSTNFTRRSFWLSLFSLLITKQFFVFSLLFYMDEPSQEKPLRKSLKRGFWMSLRLIPALLLFGFFSKGLTLIAEGIRFAVAALFSNVLPSQLFFDQIIVAPLEAVGLVAMYFFNLAVLYTLYTKVMAKHRDLFFEDISEQSNEPN
jgi:hypothetical protein